MKHQNIILMLLSVVVVFFILLVGVLLAEKMVPAALGSLVLAFVVMGYGFRLKRKWNT